MTAIDERPDLTEFEAEWELPREPRHLPYWVTSTFAQFGAAILRIVLWCVVLVVLFVLGLHACGAGARAVQDKLDTVTENSQP